MRDFKANRKRGGLSNAASSQRARRVFATRTPRARHLGPVLIKRTLEPESNNTQKAIEYFFVMAIIIFEVTASKNELMLRLNQSLRFFNQEVFIRPRLRFPWFLPYFTVVVYPCITWRIGYLYVIIVIYKYILQNNSFKKRGGCRCIS